MTKVKVKNESDTAKKEIRQSGQLLSKHLINVREILTWSNATPIRTQTDMGYSCCYCEHVYKDPADLKKHTIDNHKGIEESSFTKRRDLNAFYVKVDITDLHCKVCQQRIINIDSLVNHLKDLHNKRLFTDIKNNLIPFKFGTENLQCCICSNQFNKFKLLLEHMNTHSRNYVCDDCDAGFVNRKRLLVHQDQHKEGTFKCNVCPEVFSTLTKMKFHIKFAHKPVRYRNKCRLCNEMFKDYNQKMKHMLEVHQVQKTQKCSACDRIFATRKAFRVHIQRDHLLERRHQCTVCDKSFFQSNCLKDHMLKHTGRRDFQCDVCLKRYGRKSTLRDHMRIHRDDRRFKCEYCGQTFVQKCSWRGHMRAKHGGRQLAKREISIKLDKSTVTKNRKQKDINQFKIEFVPIDNNLKLTAKKKPKENSDVPMRDLLKHDNNFKVVLENSNATPIRYHIGSGYVCCFCTNQYPDPADLKEHTLNSHDSVDRHLYMKKQSPYGFILKVDITALKCKLCDFGMKTLKELFDHLQNVHKKIMYMEVVNYIVPFKFDDDQLKCVICGIAFGKFKGLQEHMNTHYRNYVCDICNAGCINRKILSRHMISHKTGAFKCDECPKVFKSIEKKRLHEYSVHKNKNLRSKCRYCEERFNTNHKRDRHMTKVHNVPPVIRKCMACERTFTSQNALRIHNKRDHLMERQYRCTECSMSFYNRFQLKIHMLKHTGKKDFQCNVCLKAFGRMYTLREHMRIHADDRRFKCEHCGRAFVQKCSLRGHMRAIHGEVDK
ncbi:jg11300 [Pararge aegeria aegeria]|uniref:Jg11300 protein n=1 Tax=Pararge aegeria aegeria TaxID=348720 RepID=A0A8S4R594_9NEOP|nr:jg11300 [Pararge aegeria aegeria]